MRKIFINIKQVLGSFPAYQLLFSCILPQCMQNIKPIEIILLMMIDFFKILIFSIFLCIFLNFLNFFYKKRRKIKEMYINLIFECFCTYLGCL